MPNYYDNYQSLIFRNFLFLFHSSYFLFRNQINNILENSNILTLYSNKFCILFSNIFFYFLPIFIFENSNFFYLYKFLYICEYVFRVLCLVINIADIIFFKNYLLIVWNAYLLFYIYLKYSISFPRKSQKIPFKLPGVEEFSDKKCVICYQKDVNWKLPCQHMYHQNCIKEWFHKKNNCPLCRKSF